MFPIPCRLSSSESLTFTAARFSTIEEVTLLNASQIDREEALDLFTFTLTLLPDYLV
jgi:hypothetical protein